MQVLKWLRRMVPGFDQLSVAERTAIRDFSLLWSLFEGTVLDNAASAGRIFDAVSALRDRGRLDLRPFRRPIEHFRRRCHDGQNFTPAFEQLKLRQNDRRPLVEAFVTGGENGEVEIIAGLLGSGPIKGLPVSARL